MSGKNYRRLVTRITGKDWTHDEFDRLLIHHRPGEVDEYVDHLYCCGYEEIQVHETRVEDCAVIDTPFDEEVKKTRELMYEYFRDRVYDIDGEYLCESLNISQDTLLDHLNYLLGCKV